ncbi:MAG: hemerythrin domain-containing protein [Bacteroidales bacterium]|nr:hemerythrin domain-containing protein [Bacteroidales bacterium]
MLHHNLITPDTKMADAIHMNYLLLPVINRFEIKLGFGDKTVEEVCTENKVNLSFFLDITNTYHDKSYFPKEKMRTYPVELIIDYLLKTHRYYFDQLLPEVEAMVEELLASCPADCDNLGLIKDFYKKYKQELEYHLKNEEQKFFPYVKALTQLEGTGQSLHSIRRQYNFSYSTHSEEHDNVISKMLDLKNIIIKYLPPNYDTAKGNNLLYWLFVFEEDLKDHERLEDIILVPALKRIEEKFTKN